MGREDLITSAINLLLEANQLFKKQAEERQVIFNRIIATCENLSSEFQEEDIDPEIVNSSNYIKSRQLSYLHQKMRVIEQKENHRDQLLNEISQLEANEQSRDELIEILEEYVEMEEATIYRLVSNYSEAQEILERSEEEAQLYEILSKNDPRLKALEALRIHPEGISMVQLSYMLGTTQYHAKKIIQELVNLNLVEKHNRLLHFIQPTEIESKNMMRNITT